MVKILGENFLCYEILINLVPKRLFLAMRVLDRKSKWLFFKATLVSLTHAMADSFSVPCNG